MHVLNIGQEFDDAHKARLSAFGQEGCAVTERCHVTPNVPDCAGLHVKTADWTILNSLRSTGRLRRESRVSHVGKLRRRSGDGVKWAGLALTDALCMQRGILAQPAHPDVLLERRLTPALAEGRAI